MKCSTCGKMDCYAHGGKVKGVHESITKGDAGTSIAGAYIGGHGYGNNVETSKRLHREKLDESRSMPKPKLQGLAEGGEVESQDEMSGIDDELMDMAADELLQAIEKKDKKQMLDSIKALVLSCKE